METTNKKLISEALAHRMYRCIEEYEAIKEHKSKTFKTVKEFCAYHGFSHQNYMKVYHRYKQNPVMESLVPMKRGPKYKSRRTDLEIESKIIELRNQGNNRYEINRILQDSKVSSPSPSTIYNILRRNGLNRLSKPMREAKRKIIMSRIGELLHVDCHDLSRGISIDGGKYYLLGIIDDYSRIAWAEVIENKKSLTVMFAVLKALNMIRMRYGIEAESIMTDNGGEFGSGKQAKNKESHPFERLLLEMKIEHKYTKPYRPQSNGKIERFWRTLQEDFLEGALYENKSDLSEELLGFLVYYNEYRPHSAIGGKTPEQMAKNG
jgi:transposase InsO family protein